MRNSLFENLIIENLEEITLPLYMCFLDRIPESPNKTITFAGNKLRYKYLIYIDNSKIEWNKTKYEGITFVKLIDRKVLLSQTVQNAQFVFFDVISTFSIGKLKTKNNVRLGRAGSVEISVGNYDIFTKMNRSTLEENLGECANKLQFALFASDFKEIISIDATKPTGITICINNKKDTIYPTCNKDYQKCYTQTEYKDGFCKIGTDRYMSTYCSSEDDCFNPTERKNGVNYWMRQPGTCERSPNTLRDSNISDVNNLVGRGIINLRKGSLDMIDNSNNLRSNIINMQERIEKQQMDLKNRIQDIEQGQNLITENDKIIKTKFDILVSRNRQLQESIDKNIFNKKVTYVVLAVAVALIIILLYGVAFFRNMQP